MKKPEMPSDEPRRLAGLRSLDVLDTPAEERFDRITRLAKALFDAPIALISLVDDKRQWFKSRQGLSACETDREISFCGHAILQNEVFWIANAVEDDRFFDNPLVIGEPHIRFYAGCPLRDKQGNALGTLCVIDSAPRERDLTLEGHLVDLARLAENELATVQLGRQQLVRSPEQRKDRIDPPTGVWNRTGILEVLGFSIGSCAERGWPLTAFVGQIADHEELGDTWSEEGSELILGEIAQVLRRAIRGYDSIGRIGDDRFLLLLAGLAPADAELRLAYFQSKLDQNPVLQSIGVRMHFGSASWSPGDDSLTAQTLIDAADESLARTRAARDTELAA